MVCIRCVSHDQPCPDCDAAKINDFDRTTFKVVIGFDTEEQLNSYFKNGSYKRIRGCNGIQRLDKVLEKEAGKMSIPLGVDPVAKKNSENNSEYIKHTDGKNVTFVNPKCLAAIKEEKPSLDEVHIKLSLAAIACMIKGGEHIDATVNPNIHMKIKLVEIMGMSVDQILEEIKEEAYNL